MPIISWYIGLHTKLGKCILLQTSRSINVIIIWREKILLLPQYDYRLVVMLLLAMEWMEWTIVGIVIAICTGLLHCGNRRIFSLQIIITFIDLLVWSSIHRIRRGWTTNSNFKLTINMINKRDQGKDSSRSPWHLLPDHNQAPNLPTFYRYLSQTYGKVVESEEK